MGRGLSAHWPILAAQLGADHAVLRLPAGDPQGDLHHQRDRVGEHELAQDHEVPGLAPERRGVVEAVLPGAAQHQQEMDDADP